MQMREPGGSAARGRVRGLVALLVGLVVLLGAGAPSVGQARATRHTAGFAVTRIEGPDRYATAARASAATFPVGVPVVYLASGLSYADSVSGGAAAGQQSGPVLLTSPGRLPDVTAAELGRLAPQRLVVLGGTSAVSAAVMDAAARYLPARGSAVRLGGLDRYATSSTVSAHAFPDGARTAYVVTGEGFPDSLAATPAAVREGAPLLLTRARTLPATTLAELRRLAPTRIVVAGGSDVVSVAVEQQLATVAPVVRRAGRDRYATAVAVAAAFGPTAGTAYVATGELFPDALAVGPVAGLAGAPVLLTRVRSLPDTTDVALTSMSVQQVVDVGDGSLEIERRAPGTSVSSVDSQQVMVAARVSGTWGTWARYEWTGRAWVAVHEAAVTAFGVNGLKPAAQRLDGDHTSPIGTFPMVYAFGTGNPGTALDYRVVTSCSWWIEDPAVADYNRWRESCAVSGHTAAVSERLMDYVTNTTGQYRQAVVIGFNYTRPIRSGPGSGSGIFLHYTPAYGSTWGCIGLSSRTELAAAMAWMNPQRHPVIVVKNA